MSDNVGVRQAAGDLKRELLTVADDLDTHYKNCIIASVVGGSVAVAGGVVAVAAGIASLFTFGMATPIAIAGAAVATSGGVTSGGSHLTKLIIDKLALKEADDKLETFKRKYTQTFTHHGAEKQVTCKEIVKKIRTLGSEGVGILSNAVGVVKTVAPSGASKVAGEVTKDAVQVLGKGVRVLGRTAGGPLAVINAVLLPLTIYDLVDASVQLHKIQQKGMKSKAGDFLREVAGLLQTLIEEEEKAEKVRLEEEERKRKERALQRKEEKKRRLEEEQRRKEEREKQRREKGGGLVVVGGSEKEEEETVSLEQFTTRMNFFMTVSMMVVMIVVIIMIVLLIVAV